MSRDGYLQLTDPIYEDMEISMNYLHGIVDTACFQRLRRIMHASYSAVYQTALHNRFTHSLGVYYLGTLASAQLYDELFKYFKDEIGIKKGNKGESKEEKKEREKENKKKEVYWARVCKVFNVACLLHDVGHAPFSHTGEFFFLNPGGDYSALHERLCNLVKDNCSEEKDPEEEEGTDAFESDIQNYKGNYAKPHEIMSAIIGLEQFPQYFNVDREPEDQYRINREFFARCITGYQYSAKGFEYDVRNAFISLLNGSVIDVDKLDYLNRDMYVLGYVQGQIDCRRLLGALTIIKKEDGYELGYYSRGARQEITNVIIASDKERQWLQNHPVSLYDGYLLRCMMKNLSEKLDINDEKQKVRLFSAEALSEDGVQLKDGVKVRLLADEDILYLSKNQFPCDESEEYFARSKRMHYLWYSEEEYKELFMLPTKDNDPDSDDEAKAKAKAAAAERNEQIKETIDAFTAAAGNEILINELLVKKLAEKRDQAAGKDKETMKKALSFAGAVLGSEKKKGEPEEFMFIKSSLSGSKFGKDELRDINLVSDRRQIVSKAGHVLLIYENKKYENKAKDMFYLYCEKPTTDTLWKVRDRLVKVFDGEK